MIPVCPSAVHSRMKRLPLALFMLATTRLPAYPDREVYQEGYECRYLIRNCACTSTIYRRVTAVCNEIGAEKALDQDNADGLGTARRCAVGQGLDRRGEAQWG